MYVMLFQKLFVQTDKSVFNCGDISQLVGRVHLWYATVIAVPSPPELVCGAIRVRPFFDLGKLL